MIAVDTSAIVAVVLGEREAESLLDAMTGTRAVMSWANFLESVIVVEARQGRDATRDLDLLIDGAAIELLPSDQDQVRRAIRAWRRFGKGRHPAALNYGDCFAYATASMHDAPLLFTGDDFRQTDLRAVHW